MFNKKLNFWRLVFVYSALTIITLTLLWNFANPGSSEPMMGTSMGNMMKQEHAAGIGIYDLFGKPEKSAQMEQMHEHHTSQSGLIVSTHVLTTSVILVLLPFIVGGSIFLAVVWLK